MIDAGIGETQLSSIMSGIGIPVPSQTTLKEYENIVGKAIEDEAQDSCRRSLEIEKKMAIEANDVLTDK